MNFPLYIAKRYLIAKKSHNAINIITAISLAGIAVGTMALIVILSVFNGFDNVVKSLINSFNPDIKVTLIEGKTFNHDLEKIKRIRELKGVAVVAEILEDKALLRYDEKQTIAIVKGVSPEYQSVSGIDSMIVEGTFMLSSHNYPFAVVGKGIDIFLNIILNSPRQMGIYVPKRSGKVSFDPEKAVNRKFLNISGVFLIEQDFDTKYIFVPLSFAQELFEYPGRINALEIKLNPNSNHQLIQQQIQQQWQRLQQQEAAAAGAGDLAAPRSRLARRGIHGVNVAVADAAGQLLLEQPALMQQVTQPVHLASLQARPSFGGQPLHLAQHRQPIGDVGALFDQDIAGLARHPGVEEQQALIQLAAHPVVNLDVLDRDTAIAGKGDEAQPAIRRDVLVLNADRPTQDLDLDPTGDARQRLRRQRLALIGVQRVQQADRHCARRAEPRAFGGDVGHRVNLDAAADAADAQCLAHQIVLHLLDRLDQLGARVADANQVVEAFLDDDEDVLVNGGAQHAAAFARIVVAEVGATAE